MIALATLVLLSTAAFVGEVPACPRSLEPIGPVEPPRLPAKLHNSFIGKIVVVATIEPTGEVARVLVDSVDLRPVGRSNEPAGYEQAALSAVAKWRYPSSSSACRHRVTITFAYDASEV